MRGVSKRYGRRASVKAMAVCLTFSLVFLSGCGGSPPPADDAGGGPRIIPLETLAEGASSDYGRIDEMPVPEDAPPECLAIDDEEEFQRLISLAYFPEPIPEVDFESNIVMAVMQGPKNTAGYSISITRAFQVGGEVTVEINAVEPEPGSMTAQVLTSPYHLVLAERASFEPRGELTFIFVHQHGDTVSQLFAEV